MEYKGRKIWVPSSFYGKEFAMDFPGEVYEGEIEKVTFRGKNKKPRWHYVMFEDKSKGHWDKLSDFEEFFTEPKENDSPEVEEEEENSHVEEEPPDNESELSSAGSSSDSSEATESESEEEEVWVDCAGEWKGNRLHCSQGLSKPNNLPDDVRNLLPHQILLLFFLHKIDHCD